MKVISEKHATVESTETSKRGFFFLKYIWSAFQNLLDDLQNVKGRKICYRDPIALSNLQFYFISLLQIKILNE